MRLCIVLQKYPDASVQGNAVGIPELLCHSIRDKLG